ncbi:MAG: PD40 domain-containing protein [Lewinellaceae bacterium]|nr:PD40 domain-containing protein [Lewinellaceae bacterium]
MTITSPTEYIIGIRWSPDGSKIATVMTEDTPVVWSAETGDKLYALAGHTAEITALQWSPDGSRIATASKDKTAKIWYITDPNSVEEVPAPTTTGFTLYPNPTAKNIHLTFGESIAHPTTIRLVTMLGVHAASVTLPAGASEWTMSVEGLPAGMYMAEWNGTARAVVVE